MRIKHVLSIGLVLGPVVLHVVSAGMRGEARQAVAGAPPTLAADWPTYNRDLAGTRFSPLTQINVKNVATLTQAWTYRLRPEPGRPVPAIDKPASSFELFQQVTPIVVNGVMYLPSGNRIVALEPETGKEIWRYELPEGLASFRGVAWWAGDGKLPARIFFTSLRKLIALRADTGALDTAFGNGGHIDLEIPYAGVPVIYRNVVLMGSNFFGPGERHIGPHLTTSKGEKGDVHAYDARTGKKVWTFHTIPRPGEVGHNTWEKDSWKDRTGNNVWSFTLTVDEQRGLVYLPVSGPGMNYYGGDRPGDNLFSNATVALDAETGKLRWYFQNIRHEIWDYNLPPAPGLIDIWSNGRTTPALAQVGKSGWMFILNRETGEPVHGIDERPQPKADVPGEWYPRTQPTPKKPGPLARVSMTGNDLVTASDTTPAHAEACRALWDKVQFRNDGPYTPWNYRPNGGPPSVVFPGMTGGVNWGGTATDPDLGYIFVNSKDEPSTGWIAPNPRYSETTKDTEFPYVQQSGGTLSAVARDADGRSLGTLPCFRPPWASLMAVNAATGEFVWRVPLGVNDNMPDGKKNVGSPGYGGPMVTAGGLLFIGATRDQRFRAFESRTGRELWSTRFDYNVTAVPITYMGRNGKQYIAVVAAANGQGNNESLHVFTLPPVDRAPSRGTVGTLGDALRRLGEAARNRPPDAPDPALNIAVNVFDNEGAEMAPWIRQMWAKVRRNWFIPAAMNTHAGRSVVRFTISTDGTLSSVGIVEASGVSSLDRQAYNAVVASSPFEPLPKTYPRKEVAITMNFFYNQTPSTTAPAR